MRSIWKGAISFGLVTIPIKLYSATEQKDVSFHQVHREDGGRIKYKRVCSVDGEEVPYADIAKGYELPTGEMVVLTDDDFADLPLTTSRRIDVLQFTPADQIDPIYFAKSYYLEPDGQGAKPYVLLRDALERSGQVAVVKIALRQRESLAALRVRDGVFVLETMLWPDEIREADFGFLEEDVPVRPQELKMAESLIDTMVADFDPAEYTDAYREALQEVIEAKVAGREIVAPEAPAEQGPAVDLMAALRASVEAAKRERQGAEAAKPQERTAAKSAAGSSAKSAGKSAAKPAAKSAAKSDGKAASDGAEEESAPRKRKTRRSA
ncbi:Ku protein [Microbispora amethystogenes]|uniref:Non-homologous end joining protein Ku n=1 Tax=Microbispora amethystogenes TaxID=1427754 RepID=A0ABQ4FGY4_9ACTN|nr:Ku protein [Microbispora amethystogenes]GIH34043.1 non-homologous end joining protein Ku [Microbispora amethystogenes]